MTPIPNGHPTAFIISNHTFTRDEISALHELLDAKEKARSRKFQLLQDRESYIIVHGLLRKILGNHLGLPAGSLHFLSSNLGKPRLILPGKSIYFNLSHSSGVSVIAFDLNHEIGADIEKAIPGFDHQSISEKYFTKVDKEYIRNPENNNSMAFYEIWTRKEALLKAAGIGIGKFLEVEVIGKRSYRIPATDEFFEGKRKFILTTRHFEGDYIVSVASDYDSGEVSWQTIGQAETESILTG